jgi:hypothetical protein
VDLAAHQRALLELIESGTSRAPSGDRDDYIDDVAASKGLRVIRDIVVSWEAYDVRRSCPLTAIALSRRGRFEEAVRKVSFGDSSAFLESRATLFLDEVARDGDAVIGAIAQFERALMAVRHGDTRRYEVEWDRDPAVIINGLFEGLWLADQAPRGRYRTVVATNLPELVVEVL